MMSRRFPTHQEHHCFEKSPTQVQKQSKGMAGTRQAVLWCMLGLLPWQARAEEVFKKLSKSSPSGTFEGRSGNGNAGASIGNEASILANRCSPHLPAVLDEEQRCQPIH